MDNDIYKILQEWHELFRSGVITEEEFTRKKAELLSGGKPPVTSSSDINQKNEAASSQANKNENVPPSIPNEEQTAPEISNVPPYFEEKNWFQKNGLWFAITAILILALGIYFLTIFHPNQNSDNSEPAPAETNNTQSAPMVQIPHFHWRVINDQDSQACRICNTVTSQGTQAKEGYHLIWPGSGFSDAQKSFVENIIEKEISNLNYTVDNPHQFINLLNDTFFIRYNAAQQSWNPSDTNLLGGLSWWSYIDMKLIKNNDSIFSLEILTDKYEGWAHEVILDDHWVIDVQNMKIFQLNDVFNLFENGQYLRNILEHHLRVQYHIPDGVALNDVDHGGILFNPHLALPKNFYFTKSGVHFLYDPYEVASFATGPIDLFVPYSEIHPIMEPPFTSFN